MRCKRVIGQVRNAKMLLGSDQSLLGQHAGLYIAYQAVLKADTLCYVMPSVYVKKVNSNYTLHRFGASSRRHRTRPSGIFLFESLFCQSQLTKNLASGKLIACVSLAYRALACIKAAARMKNMSYSNLVSQSANYQTAFPHLDLFESVCDRRLGNCSPKSEMLLGNSARSVSNCIQSVAAPIPSNEENLQTPQRFDIATESPRRSKIYLSGNESFHTPSAVVSVAPLVHLRGFFSVTVMKSRGCESPWSSRHIKPQTGICSLVMKPLYISPCYTRTAMKVL